jgi:hypothetical protein
LRRMLNLEQQTVAALRADLAAAHATLRAIDAPITRQGWPPDAPRSPRTRLRPRSRARREPARKRGILARLFGR